MKKKQKTQSLGTKTRVFLACPGPKSGICANHRNATNATIAVKPVSKNEKKATHGGNRNKLVEQIRCKNAKR